MIRSYAVSLALTALLGAGGALAQEPAPAEAAPPARVPAPESPPVSASEGTAAQEPAPAEAAAPAAAPAARAPAPESPPVSASEGTAAQEPAPAEAAAPAAAPAARAPAPESPPVSASEQKELHRWHRSEPAPESPPVSASKGTAASNKKFVLGLRTGLGLPFGKVSSDASQGISHGVTAQIPIWLDIGYMVAPNLMFGLYGQYGPIITHNCDPGASCSGSDIRFGFQVQYHYSPNEKQDRWYGIGIGYEILSLKESAGGAELSASANGFEFAHLQAGLDFKVSPTFRIGPFGGFSLGQFSSSEITRASGSSSADITNRALHGWLTLGVRGAFYL